MADTSTSAPSRTSVTTVVRVGGPSDSVAVDVVHRLEIGRALQEHADAHHLRQRRPGRVEPPLQLLQRLARLGLDIDALPACYRQAR